MTELEGTAMLEIGRRSERLPANAFAPDFLARLSRCDEPPSAAEAEAEGPWEVLPGRGPEGAGFGLWALGARRPAAFFRRRAAALLALAARQAAGRDAFYRLGTEREAEGFAVLAEGVPIGRLELFDEDWVAALNAYEHLVRSPEALATVMEAAGPLALERAGQILQARLQG